MAERKAMDSRFVQKHLLDHITKRKDFQVLTTNIAWVMPFEADVLMIDKEFRITEYEIKVSRTDFKRDFAKSKNGVLKHDFLTGKGAMNNNFYQSKRPNKFYFVCPSGLISRKEIPAEFGLIYVLPFGQVSIEKRPKQLHNEKVDLKFTLEVARNICIKQFRYNGR